MIVHLVDGTYELFRYFFALPSHVTADGREVAAARGVLGSMVGLLEDGATHVGIATDHVIESFRNDLWPGYKTGAGVDPALLAQFGLLEEVLAAAGFVVWPMVEVEADDALASAAAVSAADVRVEQVRICTPDKDLGQCVVGDRVVQVDRRKATVLDEAGVTAKFGVPPGSIPDWLGLVGDSADGFPGLPGWGAKGAATVLARYGHLGEIPPDGRDWDVSVRGAAKLAAVLQQQYDDALLFRRLATLVGDALPGLSVDDLAWTGPRPDFADLARRIDAPNLVARVERLVAARRRQGEGPTS
ncbi:MAG: flap endonuclease [Acidimicrobiales bacterium]|jgi:5'-3' exonuclease|nr:flap endonuclease [Acidimicrobiales bacterium]